MEHPKSKSTQPRFATRWVTLYNSSLDVLEAVEAGALLEHARRVLHEGGLHGGRGAEAGNSKWAQSRHYSCTLRGNPLSRDVLFSFLLEVPVTNWAAQ